MSNYGLTDKETTEAVDDLVTTLRNSGVVVHTIQKEWNSLSKKVRENATGCFATTKGEIYLNPMAISLTTPIHEYTHLWISALKQTNPKNWAEIVQALKRDCKDIWETVQKIYNLTNDNEIAEEVLARYSERKGAKRIAEGKITTRNSTDKLLNKGFILRQWNKLIETLKDFWSNVANILNIKSTNIDDLADMILYLLLTLLSKLFNAYLKDFSSLSMVPNI